MSDHVELQSAIICAHPAELKLAIAQGPHLSIYADGRIVPVSTAHTASIRAVAFSTDGAIIASVSDDKILSVADASSGALLNRQTFDKKLTSVIFVDQGIVVGDRFGVVYLIENAANDDAIVSEILGHIETITALSALPSIIISADIDSKIRCSNWPRAYNIESFCFGHQGAITALCIVTSSSFVSAGEDGTVRFWDVSSGRQLALHECAESTPVLSVAFDAANSLLAFVASGSKQVHFCTVESNQFSKMSSVSLELEPVSLCFNASRLFVASANSICSLVLDESRNLTLEASHSVADEYMAKTSAAITPVPFIFDEISRKKETERRQEKRAKLNRKSVADGSVSD